jgi:hypothetical protein
MNPKLASATIVVLLLLPTLRGQNDSESSPPSPDPESEVLYKSPKGTYKIQTRRKDERVWIVSLKNPSDAKVLPNGTRIGMEASAPPDENWLFYAGELYRRGDGLNFVPFKGAHWFQKNVVAYAVKRFHFSRPDIGASSAQWSCDSGRLLVEISRTKEEEEEERYAYFNVRTNTFEETPYLQMVNATLTHVTGAARFEGYPSAQFSGGGAGKHMVFTEPLDPLPPETDLRSRFEALDSRMNELHKKFLDSRPADAVDIVRESQQTWNSARAQAIKLYLPFAPKGDEERYRLQFLCDLTAEEVSQLDDFDHPISNPSNL